MSYLLEPGSVLLLVARTETLLKQLKEELQSFAELVIYCMAVDLSTREGVNETVRVARQEAENKFEFKI